MPLLILLTYAFEYQAIELSTQAAIVGLKTTLELEHQLACAVTLARIEASKLTGANIKAGNEPRTTKLSNVSRA